MFPHFMLLLMMLEPARGNPDTEDVDNSPRFIASLVTVVLTLGVTYLFYPAIVAARGSPFNKSSLRIETLHPSSQSSKSEEHKPEKGEVLLSIVIPAYNEESRLPKMLSEAYSYLSHAEENGSNLCPALRDLVSAVKEGHKWSSSSSIASFGLEWIVVNDGSEDTTCQVYRSYVSKLSTSPKSPPMSWKLISLDDNSGKGAAVQAGMLAASGAFRLMVDADGATDFGPGLEALARHCCLKEFLPGKKHSSLVPTEVLLGSREGSDKNSAETAKRSWIRSLLMHAFHVFVVWLVAAGDIRDTQCGFKMFTAEAAMQLFGNLHLRRWAFDTEIVFLAKHLEYSIREVVVPWEEVAGSKLNTSPFNLALVAVTMLRDMVCVRLCYTFGVWTTSRKTVIRTG